MKKMMLFGALALATAVAGHAQESRQEVSVSGFVPISPTVQGSGVTASQTLTTGFLGSYRYDLTPRSQLELNYSFAQNSFRYSSNPVPVGRIHARQQEISGAYVYTRNYGNFNPFLEVGVGGLIYTPIRDNGNGNLDARQNTAIGGLFGGGVAYEISPSFDIRLGYRAFLAKYPDFGLGNSGYKTNRYFVTSEPTLGVAYHF